MGSFLSHSRAATIAILESLWELVKVLVASPFSGDLILPIVGLMLLVSC